MVAPSLCSPSHGDGGMVHRVRRGHEPILIAMDEGGVRDSVSVVPARDSLARWLWLHHPIEVRYEGEAES